MKLRSRTVRVGNDSLKILYIQREIKPPKYNKIKKFKVKVK